MSVKVRRVFVSPGKWQWVASCSHCDDNLDWIFPAGSVVRAEGWVDAVWWSRWHVEEHRRTTCGACLRPHQVPSVTPVNNTTATVGERVFKRDGVGWRELS
jgi:hypothetical protein